MTVQRRPVPERLPLAHLPTPIHHLSRFSKEVGLDIYLWRDDLTGFVESGNKIRKLEYAFAEICASGADHVVTCGGPQSNHARATVWLARRLGLGVSVVVRRPQQGLAAGAETTGNLLLNRIAGADIQWISFDDYKAQGATYAPFLEREARRMSSMGKRVAVIPEGASYPAGVLGYMFGLEEARQTWRTSGFPGSFAESVVCAVGSGGTLAGLYLGFHRQKLAMERLFAVNVCDDRAYFERRCGQMIDDTCATYDLPRPAASLNILDGYVGAGYSLASDEDLRFYAHLARVEGVLLDPCYTGKAFRGMVAEIAKDKTRFGRSVLFLHSGGTLATPAYGAQWDRQLPVPM
jgi:D-cysteine desulfhydrase